MHDYLDVIFFRKALFSKYFPPTLKRKAGVFKFLRFEERLRKATSSRWISVDGRPGRRYTAAFSNFCGVMLRGAFVMVPLLCFVLFLSFVCVFLVVTLYFSKV